MVFPPGEPLRCDGDYCACVVALKEPCFILFWTGQPVIRKSRPYHNAYTFLTSTCPPFYSHFAVDLPPPSDEKEVQQVQQDGCFQNFYRASYFVEEASLSGEVAELLLFARLTPCLVLLFLPFFSAPALQALLPLFEVSSLE